MSVHRVSYTSGTRMSLSETCLMPVKSRGKDAMKAQRPLPQTYQGQTNFFLPPPSHLSPGIPPPHLL